MDISGPTPTFTQRNVGSERAWSNMTVLADGTVLLTGGSKGVPMAPATRDRTNNAMIWHPDTTNGPMILAPQSGASTIQTPCSCPMVPFYRRAAVPLDL